MFVGLCGIPVFGGIVEGLSPEGEPVLVGGTVTDIGGIFQQVGLW